MIGEHSIVTVLLLAILCAPMAALDGSRSLSDYEYERWHIRQGLVYGAVHEIVQTADGYLWLGTQQGLVRFNGSSFVLFDESRTQGLISGDVRRLLLDPKEGLLVCSSGGAGLVRYNHGQFSPVPIGSTASVNCRTVTRDRSGNLWVGTHFGGLRIAHSDGRVESYTTANGLAGDAVKAILEDRHGDVWVATYQGAGLSRFRNGKIQNFGTKEGLPDNRVRNLLQDRAGRLWILTWDGLALMEDGPPGGSSIRKVPGISSPRVIAALEDSQSNLWFGTVGGGLNRLTAGRFSAISSRNGSAPDEVLSVFEDREGSLWIGGGDGSLTRIRDRKVTLLTQRDGLPNDNVKTVFEDSHGTLWIGTSVGAARLKDGKVVPFRSSPLDSAFVTALAEDSQGAVWIGTLGSGVCRVYDTAQTCYTTAHGLSSNTIRAIVAGRDGVVWIATVDGLTSFARGTFTTYRTSAGLSDDDVNALLVDDGGGLWLGAKGGLSRFDGERFVTLRTQVSPPGGVASLFQSRDGAIWAGTRHGLFVWKDGQTYPVSLPELSEHGAIVQIVRDPTGHLWVRTETDVCRFEGFVDDGRATRPPPSLRLRYIEPNSGLAYSTASTSQQPAAISTRSGQLWFASFKGLISVNSREFKFSEAPPPVVIEDILVDGNKSGISGLIELPSDSRAVTFRFSALSFAGPGSTRFKYKLMGYDDDWIYAQDRREVTYGRLSAGGYTFRVIAASEDGIWNETGASVRLHKAPSWFMRWWFLGICLAVLVSAAWLVHRRRLYSVRLRAGAILEERARIARELHDTLEQGVAAITIQLDAIALKLERSSSTARECLDVTRTMARHVLAEARQAVLDMGSATLQESDGFPAALQRVAFELTNGTSMRINFSQKGKPIGIPPQTELHLLRIGQEALANAVRHSGAECIELLLSMQEGALRLSIRDDGRGFEPEAAPSALSGHFGLLTMRQRASRIGATLTVESEPGHGTAVIVRADLTAHRRIGARTS